MDYLKWKNCCRHRSKGIFISVLCLSIFLFIITERSGLRLPFPHIYETRVPPDIVYRNSSRIPPANQGRMWPEQRYLYERSVTDIRELADPNKTIIRLEGKSDIEIGDTVHLTVVLYDGFHKRKKVGGDLVRVWMREHSLNASSNAKVIDNNDGSYTAILTAFWVGQPEIVAAIISPREVTAFALKRRYILPTVLMNTGIFEHPEDSSISEETPCNYDPQVPGYDVMCNLTEDNFGIPWYCGKPRTFRLSCSDWSMIGAWNLWQLGIEQKHLSPLELQLLSLNRKAAVIRQRLQLNVRQANNQQLITANTRCKGTSSTLTWMNGSPTGYLYNRKWYYKHCQRETDFTATYQECLKNTKILLLGDSTMRQLFLEFEKLVSCEWVTERWSKKGKHRPVTCVNKTLNLTLTYALHQLPFCTQNTPRHYFKSLRAYVNEARGHQRTVIIINLFAHFLNYHSHVYFESLQRLRKDISSLLDVQPNATIIIKGPHAFSFAKNTDSVLWMPDIYANIYQDLLYETFQHLNDRVIYLNSLDMTVSSEQWHIHSESYIIRELVLNALGYIC